MQYSQEGRRNDSALPRAGKGGGKLTCWVNDDEICRSDLILKNKSKNINTQNAVYIDVLILKKCHFCMIPNIIFRDIKRIDCYFLVR